jgi:hypothetical protein
MNDAHQHRIYSPWYHFRVWSHYTHVLAKIAETLFQPRHHGQEIVVEHEIVARGVEHALCRFEKGEEGESVSEL